MSPLKAATPEGFIGALKGTVSIVVVRSEKEEMCQLADPLIATMVNTFIERVQLLQIDVDDPSMGTKEILKIAGFTGAHAEFIPYIALFDGTDRVASSAGLDGIAPIREELEKLLGRTAQAETLQ